MMLAVAILEILAVIMVILALSCLVWKAMQMKNESERISRNKKIISEYPFLAYKSYDFDNDIYYIPDDYDYEVTWYDNIPIGWQKAFGMDLCRELKEALDEYDYTDKYVIEEVKEKFGGLRVYDNGIPKGCRAWDVIQKYADISEKTCIACGKPATKISLGWICPYCDECAEKMEGVKKFATIDHVIS